MKGYNMKLYQSLSGHLIAVEDSHTDNRVTYECLSCGMGETLDKEAFDLALDGLLAIGEVVEVCLVPILGEVQYD
jgi:hypothetical protein